MKREVNYGRWNREAYCLLAAQLGFFPLLGLMSPSVFPSLGAALTALGVYSLGVYAWTLSYFWRAGEQDRRLREFRRTWGNPTQRAAVRKPQ